MKQTAAVDINGIPCHGLEHNRRVICAVRVLLRMQLHCYNHRLCAGSSCNAILRPLSHTSTPRSASQRHRCVATCSIKARWCIDIKYGVKMEAIALLQEWVQSIGSQAGLTANNTTILSGAVGAPESRLELEVELDSLAQLENFWRQIPPQAHKAWSQRAQHFLIDGSPQWEVYRTVSVPTQPEQKSALSQPAIEQVQTESGLILPDFAHSQEAVIADAGADLPEGATAQAEDVMLDWKGDPMQINPGDRLPFNFK